MHSETIDWVWDSTMMVLGMILGLVYVILMMEMVLGGGSYDEIYWKWSGMHSGSTYWVWDVTMVILGVILGVILMLLMILQNILYWWPLNVLLNVY